mgnify:CR=1 FL=1|tara:strand:+ start:55 stop:546 length:492 start_codon:yes stop_codon:yes gene_type:complete
MKNINELALHDKKWRSIALRITTNKSSADDLVQEMYMKLMELDKEVNDYYVTLTLKSLFIDSIRKNKTQGLLDGEKIRDTSSDFEPDDEEQELLEKIKELPYHQQEFLEESYDRSLREIEEIYKINYGYINREIHKALDAVLGDDKEDLYLNKSMKIRKAKNK